MKYLLKQSLTACALALVPTIAAAQQPAAAVESSAAAPALAVPQAPPASAVPEPLRHRITFSVLWGPDNSFSGKVIDQASGLHQGKTPVTFRETSYDDFYGRMGLFKLGVGYRTSPRSEANFNLVISRSSGEIHEVGSVGDANAPLSARLGDYNYWGFEAGQRFFFTQVRFTPFVGYTLGLNRFDDITGHFESPAVALPGGDVQPALVADNVLFYDSSWAFSGGPTAGVLVGLGPVEAMVELSFRYMGGLGDTNLATSAGLPEINDESSRWSIPILFGARVRF
jgi:hypothetical protein